VELFYRNKRERILIKEKEEKIKNKEKRNNQMLG